MEDIYARTRSRREGDSTSTSSVAFNFPPLEPSTKGNSLLRKVRSARSFDLPDRSRAFVDCFRAHALPPESSFLLPLHFSSIDEYGDCEHSLSLPVLLGPKNPTVLTKLHSPYPTLPPIVTQSIITGHSLYPYIVNILKFCSYEHKY